MGKTWQWMPNMFTVALRSSRHVQIHLSDGKSMRFRIVHRADFKVRQHFHSLRNFVCLIMSLSMLAAVSQYWTENSEERAELGVLFGCQGVSVEGKCFHHLFCFLNHFNLISYFISFALCDLNIFRSPCQKNVLLLDEEESFWFYRFHICFLFSKSPATEPHHFATKLWFNDSTERCEIPSVERAVA